MVLQVPAEGAVHHPDVHPGDHDSSDLVLDVPQQARELPLLLREVVDVPDVLGVLQELLVLGAQVEREAAAEEAGVQVRPV